MLETTVGNLRNVVRGSQGSIFSRRVDRRTIFGNPFKKGSRDSQCDRYQKYFDMRIIEDNDFRKKVLALEGCTLYCWCAPKRCHADTIANWLNNGKDVNHER